MSNEEKEQVIKNYIEMFKTLPPLDVTFDYYDDLYIDLMEKAISNFEPITPDVLDKALSTINNDLEINDPEEAEKDFSKGREKKTDFMSDDDKKMLGVK